MPPDGSQFQPIHVVMTGLMGTGDFWSCVQPSIIVDGIDPSIRGTIKKLINSQGVVINPQAVVLVNISGDIYNAGGGGGGAGSTVNLNQVAGNSTSVGAGTTDNGTLRVVVASDDTVGVSFPGGVNTVPPVTGVNIIGGGIGGRFSASGDLTVREQAVIGIQIIGGSVGAQVQPSGDFPIRIAAATVGLGITGDVSTLPKAGQTWPISVATPLGFQIIGGGTNRVSISGDSLNTVQQGVIGVNIVGGMVGARISASGDLTIAPSTSNFGRIPVSGDGATVDGANPTIRGTVKSYTRANPVVVALSNASGDIYNPSDRPKAIVSETKSGLASTQGSYVIATCPSTNRLWVTRYEFQSLNSRSYIHLASGASGSQFTPRWILDPVFVGQIYASAPYPSGLFCTPPGGSISIEMAGQNVSYAVSYFTGDA